MMPLIYPRGKKDKEKEKEKEKDREKILKNPRRTAVFEKKDNDDDDDDDKDADNKNKNNTAVLAAEIKQIDPADLKNTNVSPHLTTMLQPPQSSIHSVMVRHARCKFVELMLMDSSHEQIDACVNTARNCLIRAGVLPIRTNDPCDGETVQALFDMLPTSPRIYSLAFIVHVMLLCPIFCQYMIAEFQVDRDRLDAFVNNIDSPITAFQLQYMMGKIRKSSTFTVHAIKQWQENIPRRSLQD